MTETTPDLADRLGYILAWQQELDTAKRAQDKRRIDRAFIWLCRHRLRLLQDSARTAQAA